MPKIYNCKIGDRVYYQNTMTGSSRTGIINSEPDEETMSINLTDVGCITPVRINDTFCSKWNVTKIEDALKDKQIMSQIKKEASEYGITEEEFMKSIKMI